MKNQKRSFLSVCFVFIAAVASAQTFIDIEAGPAFTGYNDLAIPSDTGSRISLKDDIVSDPALSVRLRVGHTFLNRHTVSVLYSPLTVRGSGTLNEDISYQGQTFSGGDSVESMYRFDSYRLTYRYAFINNDDLLVAAGITGKVRSADIAVMSGSGYAHRSDLGVVPLINFSVRWNFAKPFSVLLDGDALVTPFGRAEDALIALQYDSSDTVTWKLGYRVLEGGSDGGGNVYTFALFHYIMAGMTVTF